MYAQYLSDYVDGLGATTGGVASGLVTVLWVGGLGYVGYKILKQSAPRRSKSRRRSTKRRKSAAKKRYSSRFLRRARATTIPMQYGHGSGAKRVMAGARLGGGKLKAADWVDEQNKLKQLNRKRRKSSRKKALRYSTAA